MQTVRHEEDSNEVNIDMSELNLQHPCAVEQVLKFENDREQKTR